jgi:hypothetical protein
MFIRASSFEHHFLSPAWIEKTFPSGQTFPSLEDYHGFSSTRGENATTPMFFDNIACVNGRRGLNGPIDAKRNNNRQ